MLYCTCNVVDVMLYILCCTYYVVHAMVNMSVLPLHDVIHSYLFKCLMLLVYYVKSSRDVHGM